MLDVINICLKRIPMESRKHDYKNRTLAAARLRKELEMLSDKVKKLMNFGPHFISVMYLKSQRIISIWKVGTMILKKKNLLRLHG